MAKTIEEIKDEVANEAGFANWNNLCFVWAGFNSQIQPYMDKVSIKFANSKLEEAAEKAKTVKTGNSGSWFDASVDKQSILNLREEV